jgi:hypothetical protein
MHQAIRCASTHHASKRGLARPQAGVLDWRQLIHACDEQQRRTDRRTGDFHHRRNKQERREQSLKRGCSYRERIRLARSRSLCGSSRDEAV